MRIKKHIFILFCDSLGAYVEVSLELNLKSDKCYSQSFLQ